MARNGDIVSGCCWSGGGTGMLMTGIGSGVVGLGVGGWPLRHHLRTSLTLATTESSSGDLDEVNARVCQRMLSSSMKVSVCNTVQCPRVRSWKVQPIRSAPVSELGRCRVVDVTGTTAGCRVGLVVGGVMAEAGEVWDAW